MILKEAKKWVSKQEQWDAPQVAAKRWRAPKLQNDGRESRLPDWRDFWGQYVLFRRDVEDGNKGDQQSRLLNLLPDAWEKRVTKEEAKRPNRNHKMKLNKEHHKKVVKRTEADVSGPFKMQSLRNALLIPVSANHEKAAIWRLDRCEVGGQTICLPAIPAWKSCDHVLEWVGQKVLHNRGLQGGDCDVQHVGAGCDTEAVMDPAGAEIGEGLHDFDDKEEPAGTAVFAFVASKLHKGGKRRTWKPLQRGWRKRKWKELCRVGERPLSFGELI